MSEFADLDLNQFKEDIAEVFDAGKAYNLYHEMTQVISKSMPDRLAYQWVKKNRPKIYVRAMKFELEFGEAVLSFNMKEVKEALDGVRGAWLHGFREAVND